MEEAFWSRLREAQPPIHSKTISLKHYGNLNNPPYKSHHISSNIFFYLPLLNSKPSSGRKRNISSHATGISMTILKVLAHKTLQKKGKLHQVKLTLGRVFHIEEPSNTIKNIPPGFL
jgi:hypothetical protein